jgi:hypothetical protein
MFERDISRAKERLGKRLTTTEPFTYWFEISASTAIAPFYKRFFEAEVNWWVFEQQMSRAANPRFDYTHERLGYHLHNADHYAAESARFDRQDLGATVDLAVKTRFNYLIRPRTTLRWFVFRGEPTKPLHEALLRLDYFHGYEYLLDGFRAWVEQQRQPFGMDMNAQGSLSAASNAASSAASSFGTRQEILSVVEFDRVLQSVDNDFILDLSPNQFVDLVAPIFELFEDAYSSPASTSQPPSDLASGEVPTAALVIFLDDKGIQPIARELERAIKEEDLRSLDRKGFLWVLSDIIASLERESGVLSSAQSSSETASEANVQASASIR